MCRLLGYCTRDEVPLAELMGEQGFADFTGLSCLHNDGWGMAWYDGAQPQIHKSPDWAGGAPAYTKLAQEPLGGLGLLHFRWATPGLAINDANSHPFQFGPYVLAHNGAIHPQHRLPEILPPAWEARLGGTTDSERYFLAIMSRLPEHDGDLVAAITATATDIEQRFDPGSLNAILLSPGQLYAINWHDPLVFPKAEQMRRRGHEPFPGELESYFDLAYRATDDAVVVASSGWPQEGWTQLPNRHVLVCDRDTLRTSVMPLTLEGAGARSLARVGSLAPANPLNMAVIKPWPVRQPGPVRLVTGPGCVSRPGRC
jgi:predicted glutamine amidotransferase